MTEREDINLDPSVLLSARGLVRHFPLARGAAVNGVDFDVREGELLALLGPSGCGKTTTLRLTGGFEKPDGGRITLRGRDITGLPPEKRGIGFVFQDYALFPHLTVRANISFGLRGRARREIDERVESMLSIIGLSDLAHRMPHQLSGGQQQRVALARTLAPAPPLVLLDEPFSNLDAAMRVDTRQEVRDLLKKAGSAAILVTHDQEEALALADRIAVMDAGTILQIDPPDAIYRNPRSEFVARFLGRSNIVEAFASGRTALTPFGSIALDEEANGQVRLAVRPEQIIVTPTATKGDGVIVGREFRGHDQLYWVLTEHMKLTALAGPNAAIPVGTPVLLTTSEPVVVCGPSAR